ncbi:unnamed protein product [Thelazia callipaeda]|uniref:Coiled-coil domain-containing protein 172 n=1 Tax=Thelazia callipaeda TaxID=103827 RepID=A0A0N5D1I0_THECL|nr:unnamed protein product [Thelazia callipaeda]
MYEPSSRKKLYFTPTTQISLEKRSQVNIGIFQLRECLEDKTRATEKLSQRKFFRLEVSSSKLVLRVEDLTKTIKEKENELGDIHQRLHKETIALQTCVTEKNLQQKEIGELRKQLEVLEKELYATKVHANNGHRENKKMEKDWEIGDARCSLLHITDHAIQIELADILAKYEQSMRHISVLEEKISLLEADKQQLTNVRHELQVSN